MGRILGIDYGGKRTGIAVTDPEQLIANGLTTVHSKDVINFLKDYLADNFVEAIVVGYPTNLDGTETDATPLVKGFVRKLRKTFTDLTIATTDEALTSQMAVDALVTSGAPKKQRQNKALVDQVSATLILQNYLEQKQP